MRKEGGVRRVVGKGGGKEGGKGRGKGERREVRREGGKAGGVRKGVRNEGREGRRKILYIPTSYPGPFSAPRLPPPRGIQV